MVFRRRKAEPTTMKCAILTPFVGGVGGLERAISWLTHEFLQCGFEVDIFAHKILSDSRFMPAKHKNINVFEVEINHSCPSLKNYNIVYAMQFIIFKFWAREFARTPAITIFLSGLPGATNALSSVSLSL